MKCESLRKTKVLIYRAFPSAAAVFVSSGIHTAFRHKPHRKTAIFHAKRCENSFVLAFYRILRLRSCRSPCGYRKPHNFGRFEVTADDRCTEGAGAGNADAGHRIPADCKITGSEDQSGAAFLQGTWACRKRRTRSAQLSDLVSAEQPLSSVRCKSHAAGNRKTEAVLLRTLPHKILSNEKRHGGLKMLVTVLCLTYMMVIILIHAIWITSIIKHDGKCHYHDCNRCPYDGWCPMQEEKQHDADRELHS